MSRKRTTMSRERDPDPKYGERLVTRFVNRIMRDGKKALAENIFYSALDQMEEATGADPLEIFQEAIENIKPAVEVRSRRVGGSTYQVPMEVRPVRQESLAIRWLSQAMEERNENRAEDRLANELLDASNDRGRAVRKKEEMHRRAEANKAFSHYRW